MSVFLNHSLKSKLFVFDSIKYSDIETSNSPSLIQTSGLMYDADISFEFSNLTFTDIFFTSSGNLFNLGHFMTNRIIIRDSTFSNLTSAHIQIGDGSSQLGTLKSKVKIMDSQFSDIYSGKSSFILANTNADAEITNCSFSQMITLGNGAVLTAGSTNAQVFISDSTFTDNSAVEGSTFSIESQSLVRCTNCNISNNFAVSSGVARIETSGYFEFYSSTISNNFAMNYLISVLLDSVNVSLFNH